MPGVKPPPDDWRWKAVPVWIAVFTVLVTFALWQGRAARNDLEKASIENCTEIEQIKEGAREAAWRDFNRLDANLRLLKIEKTQEIIDVAIAARDERLTRSKRESCPRTILPPP